jgi:hypothetical protein
MCNMSGLARDSVQAQERLFRLAKRDHNLSIQTLHLETKIPKTTLEGWKNGATMPAWALGALGKAGVPEYLLSLILDPFQRFVGKSETGDGIYHEAAAEANAYVQEWLSATNPNSENGASLSPREAARLAEVARRAGGKLRAVAA